MFDELDILTTVLKTDATLDNTWFFDGQKIIFYNNRHEEVANAVCDNDSFGHEEGLIEVTGKPLCDDEYNGAEGWLTAAEVYSRWANYVMMED